MINVTTQTKAIVLALSMNVLCMLCLCLHPFSAKAEEFEDYYLTHVYPQDAFKTESKDEKYKVRMRKNLNKKDRIYEGQGIKTPKIKVKGYDTIPLTYELHVDANNNGQRQMVSRIGLVFNTDTDEICINNLYYTNFKFKESGKMYCIKMTYLDEIRALKKQQQSKTQSK